MRIPAALRASLLTLYCLLLPLAGVCSGANLTVSPVRLDLSPWERAVALTVTNRGDEKVLIQSELLHWAMKGGEDSYSASTALIVNPPIFELSPGQEQVVRIGLRTPERGATEASYRLYLQEVPLPGGTPGQGLRMRLRIGVPVFVLPAGPAQPLLQWGLSRNTDRCLDLTLANQGASHAHLWDLKVCSPAEKGPCSKPQGATYLLAGTSRQWHLAPDDFLKQKKLRVLAESDQGAVDITLEVTNR